MLTSFANLRRSLNSRRRSRRRLSATDPLEPRCLLTPQLISLAGEATSGDDDSLNPQLSRNGRYVVFQSEADNLVTMNGTDGNGFVDVFVRDLETGETILISVSPEGTAGDGHSFQPSISDDGRFVAFGSLARNLTKDEFTFVGGSHVFVRDRDRDEDGVFDEPGDSQTILVTRDAVTPETTSDMNSGGGSTGDSWTGRPLISGDGSTIVFASSATNLLDPAGLPTDGILDLDLYQATAPFDGSVELVSVNFSGTAAAIIPGTVGVAFKPAISEDGQTIAYESSNSDIVPDDDEGFSDIFAGGSGSGTRLSVGIDGEGGNGNSHEPIISRNGRYVVFRSEATNLVENDKNDIQDVFVADLKTDRVALVSMSRDPASESRTANRLSPGSPSLVDNEAGYAISDNGRFIVFSSSATDLLDPSLGITDTNDVSDVFVFDRDADEDGVYDEPGPLATRTIPISTSADGMAMTNSIFATGGSNAVSISGDGRYVVFTSPGSDLMEGSSTGMTVYLRDLQAETTFLVGDSGTPLALQISVTEIAIATEPLRVVFSSGVDLDPNVTDTNTKLDVFNFDAPIDIRMRGAIGDGYDLLEIQYEVQNAAAAEPFEIGIYRSADGVFGEGDVLLDTVLIEGTDLDLGGHSLVREIGAETADQIVLPGIGESAIEDNLDYQILFVADHLNQIEEFDGSAFNDDNTARFQNAYHLPGGPVFIHGRTGLISGNDILTVSEIDEALTEVRLNFSTYGYDPADVTSVRFRGHEGNDTAQAAGTPDLLIGGSGSDGLRGGPGDDWIDGGIDDDKLLGEGGFDTILDGMGDDFIDLGPDGGVIIATPGSDDIFLGLGDESFLDFSFADDAINIDLEAFDVIQTVDSDDNTITLRGDEFDFNFLGSPFDDEVFVKVKDRDRVINGGDGNDRINIDAGGTSVTFDGTTLTPATGGTLTLLNFEDMNIFNFPPVTIDNSDAGYSDTGFFDSDPNFQQGVNGGVRFGTAGNGDTGTWTFNDLPPGRAFIAATWTSAPDRATNATYVIKSGTTTIAEIPVNQQITPSDFQADGFGWVDLTMIDIDPTLNDITVQISDSSADGFVTADAVRVYPVGDLVAPRIQVTAVDLDVGQTVPIDHGGTFDIGNVAHVADDVTRRSTTSFVIQNRGEGRLVLDQATVTGPFSLTQSTHEVPTNGAGNITVTLDTNQAGSHSGTVTIPSNDPSQPNFAFQVEATVVQITTPPDGTFEVNYHQSANHQINIVAKFLEVTPSNIEDIGLDFDVELNIDPDDDGIYESAQFTTTQSDDDATITITPALDVFSINAVFTDPQFQVVLRALSRTKSGDLLTAPSVVNLGRRDQIEIIREFIYPTEFNPPQTPQQFVALGSEPFNAVTHTKVAWFIDDELVHTSETEPFIGDISGRPTDRESILKAVSTDIYGVSRTSTLTLTPQNVGTVAGQKWHDRNGNGVKDSDEPGLNGWLIEVYDDVGQVVATTTTRDIDLDYDNQIDPLTEAGLYRVNVDAGSWRVREVPRDGWRQTSPSVEQAAETAFNLDRDLDSHATQSDFENWGGRGEKWFYGARNRQWLFVIADGSVFEWDGSGRDNLTGTKVGQLDSRFHDDISKIHEAANPGVVIVDVTSGQTTNDVSFGNVALGAIEGRKWHDLNADGVRDASEPWLNGWTIQLYDNDGNVVATTVTADRDVNNDQQIDPETEAGWYLFEQLGSGSFAVGEEARTVWTQTFPDSPVAQTAFDLDQSLKFRATKSDFLNWGGLNERWLQSDQGWHYIVPNGEVFKWDNSPKTALTGTQVASLTPDYWENFERIHNAVTPGRYRVRMGDDTVSNIDFGNVQN